MSIFKNIVKNLISDNEKVYSCFGKLPFKDEFIRYNLKPGMFDFFDKWVSEGFKKYVEEAVENDVTVEKFKTLKYYFLSGGKKEPICGLVFSSNDKSQRQHPFSFFKKISEQGYLEFKQVIPFMQHDKLCSTKNDLISKVDDFYSLKVSIDGFSNVDESINRRSILNSVISVLNEKITINPSKFKNDVRKCFSEFFCEERKVIKFPLFCQNGFRKSLLIFWYQLFIEHDLFNENMFSFYQDCDKPFLFISNGLPDSAVFSCLVGSELCKEKVIGYDFFSFGDEGSLQDMVMSDVLLMLRK